MSDQLKRVQLGVLLLLFITFPALVRLYTDYLWFQAMGYVGVFFTIIKTKIALGIAGALLLFIVLFINAQIASRSYTISKTDDGDTEIILPENINVLVIGVMGIVALFFGMTISGSWETVLRYINRESFSVIDPLFGKDVGFFIFELPFYKAALRVGFISVFFTGLFTLLVYLLKSKSLLFDMTFSDVKFEVPKFTSWAKAHLYVLLALLFILLGVNYRLQAYDLLFSSRSDTFFGPGFTDITVALPALKFLFFLSILTALSMLLNIWIKKPWMSAALVVLIFAVNILVLGLYAGVVQEYRALPNEIKIETPYIENNIRYTTLAFGLDTVDARPFDVTSNLTLSDIENNSATIKNIRLWDPRPLKDTYKQLQEIRNYYEFNDVDVDRYTIDGQLVELMLSAREIDPSGLEATAQNWINDHLVFTHGYGLVASPVNKKTAKGLPELLIKDIPPESEQFVVERPEIYFGEITDKYAIVNTGTEDVELDYPMGDKNQYTKYKEDSGVQLSSYLRKLAMSIRFTSTKILFSRDITKESRILFNRDIRSITSEITPYLFYDRDPYIVVSEGRLYWILDGYTTSTRYPYSTRTKGISYIRNPVKTVIDTYTGETTFYIVDDSDPIIKTYSRIFEGVFKPFDEMPIDLRAHMRYPEDMFTIQAEVYSKYHMKDPRVFYNSEDLWSIPTERYEDSTIKMEPYYIIMKLPFEEKEEFILMQPFTPVNKDLMIAWMYGRSDPEHYGKLGVFKFTKQEQIFGPMQIEALIDQTTEISSQLSLWDQSGSKVIRGNLLVIPIEEDILYVEPLYLRAENGQLPQLARVIISYGDNIVMEEDLDMALEKLFGASDRPISTETRGPGGIMNRTNLPSQALQHYNRALAELKAGNWTEFGDELGALGEILLDLERGNATAIA